MATQYTSILKLALPVQGELSGTWGDTVNDNITSMVEEAIAGRAVINSWTTNSHTLSTANGTTSESRCAMLEFTDTGAALTGAGTVICPTATKIYIAKNGSGQAITLKTSGGTGIAVPDGETMFLFCDGTNVVEAITSVKTLKIADGVQVNTILDEDNMASDSATALATQQSIKAYVDAQVTAQDLDFAGDTGTGAVDLDSQSLTISGTANEIETSASGQTITIGLPTAVTVTTVTATNVQATNIKANDGTASITIADTTGQATINNAVLTTADINAGTIDNSVIGGTTAAAGSFTTVSASGNIDTTNSVVTDTIAEKTATTGVTVDGVLLKDGGATFTGATNYGDNVKAQFGASDDLQIYHDGSNSYITDVGTGNLWITGDDEVNIANQVIDEYKARFITNGAVQLFYDSALKFATNSGGVTVTGTVTFDGGTTSADLNFGDNDRAVFGAGSDLLVYHDGSHSHILDNGNGDLFIAGSDNIIIRDSTTDESFIRCTKDEDVELYYNGVEKLATTSYGIDISGSVVADTNTSINVGATPTPDMANYQNFIWTLNANANLGNPSTEKVGQTGFFVFIQDGTGGRTLSLGSEYKTAGGAGITLSTAAGAVDVVPYIVQTTGTILLGTPLLAFA